MIAKISGVTFNPPRTTGQTTAYASSTAERVVNSVIIPGGSLRNDDHLGIDSRVIKSGAFGTVTVRIRIGTVANTSQTLVATYTSSSAAHTYVPIMRRLLLYNVASSTYVFTAATSNSWDYAGPSIGWQNLTTIDWASDQYIIITTQCASASDTIYCPYIITDFQAAVR
jgi:hypothetical protein